MTLGGEQVVVFDRKMSVILQLGISQLLLVIVLFVSLPASPTQLYDPLESETVFPQLLLVHTKETNQMTELILNSDIFANTTSLPIGTTLNSTIENGSVPVVWKLVNVTFPALVTFELAVSEPINSVLSDCVIYASQKGEGGGRKNVSEVIERNGATVERLRSSFLVTNIVSQWYIVFDPRGRNGTYTIWAHQQLAGYSFDTAMAIADNSTVNGTFNFVGCSHYWELTLESGQRAVVNIDAEDASIIADLVAVWQDSPESTKKTETKSSKEESWTIQFKSSKPMAFTYCLVLKQPNDPDNVKIGTYEITIQLEQEGYNFDTANDLDQTNLSMVVDIKYPDARPHFKFQVSNRSRITILVTEVDADLLEQARVEVFSHDKKTTIASLREEDGDDGKILGEFITDKPGEHYYYLEISPYASPPGEISITLTIEQFPETFSWNFEAQLATLLILGAFPFLVYFQRKKFGVQRNQWNVGAPADKVYRTLFESQRFEIYGMIPDRLLKTRATILGSKYTQSILLDRVGEEETLIMTSRKARLWECILSLLIVLSVYMIINFLLIVWSPNDHFFPLQMKTVSDILPITSIVVLMTILVSIAVILRREQYKRFEEEVEEIIHDFYRHEKGVLLSEEQNKAFLEKQMDKNIAYVRVLWNQAKSAFKEVNYDLFVIKADAAVKKLLETRFTQVYGYSEFDSSIEFRILCERVRVAGFDIPKTKKIEHHRKLRNYIVHSSRVLDEDESAETYSYYAKFLGRLGLRA